jgi:hypothetical protein
LLHPEGIIQIFVANYSYCYYCVDFIVMTLCFVKTEGKMKILFMLISVGFVIYIVDGVSDAMNRQEKEEKAMSRDNFRNAVMYRAPDQIIANVGNPTTTQQAGNTEYWNYHNATKDLITGKLDYNAQVVIDNGKVREVNF